MAKSDPYHADRLLAGRPGLSVAEKEAMLADLLDDPALRPRRRPAPLWRPLVLAGAVGAAALLVLLVLPDSPELVPRGGPPQAALALSCASGPCRPGDTLRFRVTPPAERPCLAAFALRADGAVIWYFPEQAGAESVRATAGWLERGIRLGAEHAPGHYRVTAVFTREPADRDAVRAIVRSGDEDAVVVETAVEIGEP